MLRPRAQRRLIKVPLRLLAGPCGLRLIFTFAFAPSARHLFAVFMPAVIDLRPPGRFPMIGLIRAVAVCAALALGLASAHAAEKAFKRDDLADAAIKLEVQIKGEAGPVSKSASTLKTDADGAFRRGDLRSGLQIL